MPNEVVNQMEAHASSRYFTGIWGDHEYTNWRDENVAAKTSCYLGDWSFLLTRRYSGPDVVRMFSDLTVNSFEVFPIGRSKHVVFCNVDGKVVHEGVVSRESDTSIVQFGRGCEYVDYVLASGKYDVRSEPLNWFKFQVSGPSALATLEAAGAGRELSGTRLMHWSTIRIAGVEMWALRMGMAGEAGFELQGDYASAEIVREALLTAGAPFGIRRLGGRSAMINHLEASFPTVGTDYVPAIFGPDMSGYLQQLLRITPNLLDFQFARGGSMLGSPVEEYYRSPLELGWSRSVVFDHEFIGRQALEREKAEPHRRIATLVWNTDDVVAVYRSMFEDDEPFPFMDMPREMVDVAYQERVFVGDRQVGIASSRGYSYWFRRMLSLAVVDPDIEIGATVEILYGDPSGPQKRVRAVVAAAPFKKDRRRDGITPE